MVKTDIVLNVLRILPLYFSLGTYRAGATRMITWDTIENLLSTYEVLSKCHLLSSQWQFTTSFHQFESGKQNQF